MADEMKLFKEWVSTIREDVETLKTVVAAEQASDDARKFAATGLNYLLTRMDLVPDWEDSIGILDDVMVIRVLAALIVQTDIDDVGDTQTQVALARLSNEADRGERWLGSELWAKFSKHAVLLVEKPVRGRSPSQMIGDAAMRTAVFGEVDDHILRLPPATFKDPEQIAVKFKSYLQHKLK